MFSQCPPPISKEGNRRCRSRYQTDKASEAFDRWSSVGDKLAQHLLFAFGVMPTLERDGSDGHANTQLNKTSGREDPKLRSKKQPDLWTGEQNSIALGS